MRLKGKNFQAWSEFDFEIEGLTVLVGPSNHGKSSLSRSLKGLLRNEIPDGFIKNGQDEPLELELEYEGHNIKATRKKGGSTKYTIDGKDYSSLGGKVPDELTKLKFGEVTIGDYSVDPQFAVQNKAQFLIDSDRWKPNELNAILGAFSSTEKLDAGKKEANLRITQRKSEATTLASEIRSAEERSAKLLEITGNATLVAGALNGLERQVHPQEERQGWLEGVEYHQTRLEPLRSFIEVLDTLDDIGASANGHGLMQKGLACVDYSRSMVETLQEFIDSLTLPDLTEVEPLARMVDSLECAAAAMDTLRFLRKLETVLDEAATTWSEIVSNVKQDRELDVLTEDKGYDTDAFGVAIATIIREVETQFIEAKALVQSISYLETASTSAATYESLTRSIDTEDSELGEAERELEATRQELAEEIAAEAAKGLCPKCGTTLEHVCHQ